MSALKITGGGLVCFALSVAPASDLRELLYWKWMSLSVSILFAIVFLIVFFAMAGRNRHLMEHHEKAIGRMRKLEAIILENGLELPAEDL